MRNTENGLKKTKIARFSIQLLAASQKQPKIYLADIKKDEKTLSEDFREQAEKRAKAALISRSVSKENNLTVTDDELEAEIKILVKKTNSQYRKKEIKFWFRVFICKYNKQWHIEYDQTNLYSRDSTCIKK
mgnify:CR=1 FL=1